MQTCICKDVSTVLQQYTGTKLQDFYIMDDDENIWRLHKYLFTLGVDLVVSLRFSLLPRALDLSRSPGNLDDLSFLTLFFGRTPLWWRFPLSSAWTLVWSSSGTTRQLSVAATLLFFLLLFRKNKIELQTRTLFMKICKNHMQAYPSKIRIANNRKEENSGKIKGITKFRNKERILCKCQN